MKHVLGVDGGGTRTRAALMGADGSIHWRGESAAGNCRAVPREALLEMLDSLWRSAAEAGYEVRGAGLGLAGLVDQATAEELRNACAGLWNLPIDAVCVESDLRSAHRGALGGQPGIVLIAGTGSSCLGRNGAGHWHRCGGWGSILGDAGSGYAIGLSGLQRVVEMADGRVEDTGLRRALLDSLKLGSPEELVAWVHGTGSRKVEIAGLSPVLLERAAGEDAAAVAIIEEAVRALVKLVETTSRCLEMERPQVVLLGGVAGDASLFQSWLKPALKATLPGIAFVSPLLPAEAGAGLAVWEQAGVPLDPAFHQKLAAAFADG